LRSASPSLPSKRDTITVCVSTRKDKSEILLVQIDSMMIDQHAP
jgi:hypothetical protein